MEVYNLNNIQIFYVKCEKCGRLFASLERYELLQNFVQHMKKHKISISLKDVPMKVAVFALKDEGGNDGT